MLRVQSIVFKALFVLLAAGWSLPSAGVIVTGGFSGQIFSGFDFGSAPGGYFGVGFDLSNQPITGTFRYDTAKVPPGIPVSANQVTYSDPTFSTDFLDFTVTINGRTYAFGVTPAFPGIQSIDVIDNTDQLQYDLDRGGIDFSEVVSLRFISDLDFLAGTGIPTHFDFIQSGVGLFPTGFFSFDLPNGDSVDGRFDLISGFARIAGLPEPGTLGTLAVGLLAIAGLRRRAARCG